MNKDYYKILGVAEFDSAENIKNAYRKLARTWHPDIAGDSTDVMLKFKEINEAYEILSNKSKKAEYDKARKFYNYARNTSSQKNEKERSYNKTTSEPYCKNRGFNFNWEELLNNKRKKESSLNNKEIKTPQNGKNINTDLEISVFDAMSGTTKIINMLETNVCPTCKGKKFINGTLCSHCNGKGEKTNYKKFSVKIPAGIKNNSKIRLAGEGEQGKNGGKNGDLYITIHIQESKNYTTDGLNILKTVPITPFEAVLGTNIKINTLNGSLNVKIAPCSQNGQKIRIAGYGIVQNEKVGDMIITLEIKIPKNLTQEEIELYKNLEKISSSNIREDY